MFLLIIILPIFLFFLFAEQSGKRKLEEETNLFPKNGLERDQFRSGCLAYKNSTYGAQNVYIKCIKNIDEILNMFIYKIEDNRIIEVAQFSFKVSEVRQGIDVQFTKSTKHQSREYERYQFKDTNGENHYMLFAQGSSKIHHHDLNSSTFENYIQFV